MEDSLDVIVLEFGSIHTRVHFSFTDRVITVPAILLPSVFLESRLGRTLGVDFLTSRM